MEPKQFRKGVYSARTLLPADRMYTAINVINTSPYVCKLAAGQIVGDACVTSVNNVRVNSEKGDATDDDTQVSRDTDEDDEDYLDPVFETLSDDLSPEERRDAVRFIHEHRQAFSKHEYDLGRTFLIPHRIDTGDNKPFRQPLRRHPRVHEEYIDGKVDEMLAHDIIAPATSPLASNMCLVKKADGSLRFCLDFRQLKYLTRKVSYPLPRISNCLDALGVIGISVS